MIHIETCEMVPISKRRTKIKMEHFEWSAEMNVHLSLLLIQILYPLWAANVTRRNSSQISGKSPHNIPDQ